MKWPKQWSFTSNVFMILFAKNYQNLPMFHAVIQKILMALFCERWSIWLWSVVRFTVVYTDYHQYLLARQCFDYTQSGHPSFGTSCGKERSALVLYARSASALRSSSAPAASVFVNELLARVAQTLLTSCANQLHLTSLDQGWSALLPFNQWRMVQNTFRT